MAQQSFQVKTVEELEREGVEFEEIRSEDAPGDEHSVELLDEAAANCRWARVNCCGTYYTICMRPGVWYCCRNGNCRTCYRI